MYFDHKQSIICGSFYNRSQEKIPSPLHYSPRNDFVENAKKKFTFGVKRDIKKQTFAPGPGYYEMISTINSSGKNIMSQIQNVSQLPTQKSSRFKSFETNVPGPGAYEVKSKSQQQ